MAIPTPPEYRTKETNMNEHHLSFTRGQIQGAAQGLTQQAKPATVSTPTVESTLKERGSRYGTFSGHARVAQDLKNVLWCALQERRKVLPPVQLEALDMICHKIGRIVNGDNNYADSWHDIAGYAQLVDDILNGKNP